MRLIYSSVICAHICLQGHALAQTNLWSDMAKEDIQAAHTLLSDNHPAALPEFGDTDFVTTLSQAKKEAFALADEVQTYQGYRAALQRFAAKFNDGHIGSRALFGTSYEWPGFLVALKSDGWRVIAHGDENARLSGAKLLDCEGRMPDDLADELIGPRVPQWSFKAQKLRLSTRLFRKEESPFSDYPSKCHFDLGNGSAVSVDLTWKPLSPDDYIKYVRKAYKISREMALEPLGEGWWVRLASLSDRASGVVQEVRQHRAQIRNAPFVIIDMRGNGGGADIYVTQLAEILFGQDKVRAVNESLNSSDDQSIIWRVSKDNFETLNSYVERFTAQLGKDHAYVTEVIGQRNAMEVALKNGDTYSTYKGEAPAPSSGLTEGKAGSPPPKVVVITDRYCFSSCLGGMRLLLDLGVIHVGEETNITKSYYEVREAMLPSGISTFTTLQAFAPNVPKNIGPFTPHYEFDGPMDDDDALLTWIQTDVLTQE